MLLSIPGRYKCKAQSAFIPLSDSPAYSVCNIIRKNKFAVLLFLFASCIAGCSQPDKDTGKDVYNNLELNGRINSFPLNVILSDKLTGNDFPADLKALCGFSKSTCKTLPIAGILRSGSDIYYTYNCFADLKIPNEAKKDESSITNAVEKQVNSYFANTRPASYDSLLTPNEPDWNIRNFARMYVSNTSDSVFFFSNEEGFPSFLQIGSRSYPVYKDVTQLRKDIDNIICKGYEKIAVFYNPVADNTPKRVTETNETLVPSTLPPTPPAKAIAVPETTPRKPNPVREQTNDEGLSISTPPPPRTDNPSARSGEPVCEQDEHRNYTGRRVQYVYNKAGDIVRTIVISKCEADCRCF